RSKPAHETSAPSRSDSESTNRIPERPAARQPERAAERSNQRESAAPRERGQGEPESASAKTSEPTSSGTAETKTTAADNKATHPVVANAAAHGTKSATSPADAVSELTAAAAGTIPATAEGELDGLQSVITPDAEAESAAKVLATADAAAASDLAGLPAVIAALLPELAAKQAATTNTPAASSATDDTDSVKLTAEMGLAGDTRNKSLQNPGGAKPKLDLAAALNGSQAQPAAVLQVKAEIPSAFAERAASALQSISGEVPAGAQASVMHSLRQAGQLPATTPQLPVATPAGQNGWANEVGTRVMWMIGRAESKAELVLTPPNLGKVEVSINLNGDQTTAQFVAATQAARDALEQAMPRLRELLAQSGISLGQTGVSTSGDQQGSGDDGTRGGGRGTASAGMEAGEAGAAKTWVRQTEGLVDTFA
ncbi:MAG: hypothetical protein CVU28_12630, partial [Betaproteobacteria bacterium HGW-Betaproteobacteria-21]